jgi:hypothetical protein
MWWTVTAEDLETAADAVEHIKYEWLYRLADAHADINPELSDRYYELGSKL